MQPVDGGTPSELWNAAARGDTLLLGQLLREGDATSAAEGVDLRVHEHTALMTAAQNGHAGAVRLLCEVEGVDLRAATELGRNAIHLAAEAGHTELVMFLAELKLVPCATTTVAPGVEETQSKAADPRTNVKMSVSFFIHSTSGVLPPIGCQTE